MSAISTTLSLIGSILLLVQLAAAASVAPSAHDSAHHAAQLAANMAALLDSPTLKMISDEDQASMQQIKYQMANDFSEFKSINEVHAFLDKVKLLVQKHPKNVAFAQGDLKELHKFLSQESVTKLIRVDTEPFVMPINDDRIPFAQKAIDDDELSRKLFSGPLRSLVESKRQQLSRAEDGNHRESNFFSNLWCKLSGCSNQ